MSYSDATIKALAALRYAASTGTPFPANDLWDAINELDNAGVFAALDEQADYASATEILAESAKARLEA